MKLSRLLTTAIDWFYIPPLRALIPLQTFRYAVCGGLNMVLNLALYYIVYNYVLRQKDVPVGTPYDMTDWIPGVVISAKIAAGCIVFPIIFLTGFWLNKQVAFQHSPLRNHTQILRYLLSVAGSLLIYYVCMTLFVDVWHIWATPAYAMQIVITTVYSYLMQKHFTFRGCENQ